ncbi:putative Ctr copper transporter family-domain-containing protein [Seiridium cardinale]|uniref:Copper transport protein n=1 Tax=Seiridium cardinale TaxID=138064 RepID=A0ABR2Y193_9PEZI
MSDVISTATATASTSTTSSISPTGTVSSSKDGMGGMTMDGCQISMLWNWYTVDTCFLSPSWKIRSQGGFAGLCIAIILMAILAQSLGWFAKYYDQRLVRQHQHKTVALATQATQNASTNGSLIAKHAHDLSPVAAFRPNLMQQAIRTLIRTVHFALAYWIMLLAIGNGWEGHKALCQDSIQNRRAAVGDSPSIRRALRKFQQNIFIIVIATTQGSVIGNFELALSSAFANVLVMIDYLRSGALDDTAVASGAKKLLKRRLTLRNAPRKQLIDTLLIYLAISDFLIGADLLCGTYSGIMAFHRPSLSCLISEA